MRARKIASFLPQSPKPLRFRILGFHENPASLRAPAFFTGDELNPVENLWQFMRDNWPSNRIFKSSDDIVDHCCYAWNTLVDQP